MVANSLRLRLTTAVLSCVAFLLSSIVAEDLCSVAPYSYTEAMSTYPELSTALKTVRKYAIASWYTDRSSKEERADLISRMLSQCPADTRLSIVVYGIPQKDCSGGYSTAGSVSSTSSYIAFLKELTDAIGSRKVLYVVEPDAVGLLTQDNGCGVSAGYLANLKVAVSALSVNPNADLYLDVGYWMLAYTNLASKVATAMKDIGKYGRVKGITINTSNYRSNDECARYCTNFQTAVGSTEMSCIVDTSRNYNGSPTTDWCNIPTAGVGKPPTSSTGYTNLDFFMWIKPPGESDGYCWGGQSAGSFFYGGFKLLWDQGYFVKELGMPKIGETVGSVSVTSAPVTAAPVPTATTPVLATPAPIQYTVAPATTAPITPAPTWSYAPTSCRVRKQFLQ